MTIGYILDDNLDVADGVQQAVINIGEKMRSMGHEVHYLVADTKRSDLKNVHSLVGQISLRFNGNSVRTPKLVSKSKIEKIFKRTDFDVLHVQMPYSPLFAGRVIKYSPDHVKIFGTFHILPYDKFTSFSTKMLGVFSRNINKKFYKTFAVSEPAKVFMKKTYDLDSEVIPNPVDYKWFSKKETNLKIKKNKNQTSLVFLGRFEVRKGVLNLAEAINTLTAAQKKGMRVVMCGKGPLLEKVKEYSNINSLDIEFPGFVSEIEKRDYLQKADIAVFPSISGESFGIVLAEAMASGAGVTLGGNNPGYTSVLNDWPETLFDPTNNKQFSNKLAQFIDNENLRNIIGKQQNQKSKIYDIDVIGKKLEVFYGCKSTSLES